jgi:L-alanine-DL-glutamate epimerase-like enolase superfamily enzyme
MHLVSDVAVPRIASVESWLIRLPLGRPIHFSSGTWSHWNYVVVRVRADDGREAAAYAFIGEIPVDVMVCELVAPLVTGVAIDDLGTVAERCASAAGPPLSDLVRPAASMIEVCLWDLAAQRADVPLWRLLCAQPARRTAPVMFVEHRRDGDTPETFAARVAALAEDGVPSVKIKHYGDVAETTARLAAIRAAVREELELVVDAAWLWPDVASAVRDARAWEEHRLAWIEDPFPPNRIADAAGLREAIDTPLGIGDMVTSIDVAERLIRSGAVDVLRIDVTTMDGIAGVARLTALAASVGVDVSPEVFAEVHQHLAFAWPSMRGVEIYTPGSGVWSADAFIRPSAMTFADAGHIVAPEQPGSGLAIDWEAVETRADRYSRHAAE